MRPRRFLIVPDEGVASATVAALGVEDDQVIESGLSVRQPTPDVDGAPVGDLRPVLTGTPEQPTSGRLCVTVTGVERGARFGFTRRESESLQLKQQPTVLCRPDNLQYLKGTIHGEPFGEYACRPKLVSLRSGRLLCTWQRQARKPEDAGSQVQQQMGQTIWRSVMEKTGEWSDPIAPFGITWGTRYLSTVELFDHAVVQYPDNDELILVTVGSRHTLLNADFTLDRRLHVNVSQDDGENWTTRAEHQLVGDTPDVELRGPEDDLVLPGNELDESSILACTATILGSGRLLVVIATQLGLYSLVSDDRGHTFRLGARMQWVEEDIRYGPIPTPPTLPSPHPPLKMAGLTSCSLENGLCWIVWAAPLWDAVNPNGYTGLYGWLTADGVDFGVRQDIGHLTPCPVTMYPAVVVRDDGWPQLYLEGHDWNCALSAVVGDLLAMRTMATRDPSMDDLAATLFPPVASFADDYGGADKPVFWQIFPMHGHSLTQSGSGDLGNSSVIENKGFSGGVAACRHRGAVYVAYCYMDEDGTGYDIEARNAAILVARTSYWQPLAERLALGFKLSGTAGWFSGPNRYSSWPRAYHLTWDSHSLPSLCGWQLDEQPPYTATLEPISLNVRRSFLDLDGGISYLRESLPNSKGNDSDAEGASSSAGAAAAVRFWIDVREGGLQTACLIGSRISLTRAPESGPYFTVEVRLSRLDVDSVQIGLYDPDTGAVLAPGPKTLTAIYDADTDEGQWIEVLYALDGDEQIRAWCYARVWDPVTDPDFLADFTRVANAPIEAHSTGAVESLRWGHIYPATLPRRSRWKLIHLHRPDSDFVDGEGGATPPFAAEAPDWAGERTTVIIPTGFINTAQPAWFLDRPDAGFINTMRAPAMLARPQWLEDGLFVAWRGDALTRGRFVYASGYDFGVGSVLQGGGREWRIPEDAADDRLVEEAGAILDGGALGIAADSIAVFGRNWPECEIALHSVNTVDGWKNPPVRIRLGLPLHDYAEPRKGTTEELHRSLADWVNDPAITEVRLVFAGRSAELRTLEVLDPARNRFRPHQFYSHPLGAGQQWYLAVRDLAHVGSFLDGSRQGREARIYRILDNDDWRLFLDASPLAYEPTWNATENEMERAAIFSDRFAVGFAEHTSVAEIPRYRYARVGIARHWRGGAETFAATRRILLGRLADLSGSDFEWGWGFDVDPGVSMTRLPNGAAIVRELRPQLHKWTCDYAQRRSPATPTHYENPGRTTPNTWREVIELLARARFGAEQCALIWQGERAIPRADTDPMYEPPDAAADLELFLVRPGGASVRHVTYECAPQRLADPAAGASVQTVSRPWIAVRSLSFEEET